MLPIILGGLQPGSLPTPGARWTVRGRWPSGSEVRFGFQYHSSKIGRAPWPPSLDEPSCLASRPRTILSRITHRLNCRPRASCPHDPGSAPLFRTRIPTGVRTDSGEERFFSRASGRACWPRRRKRGSGSLDPTRMRVLRHWRRIRWRSAALFLQ